jgi:hypothetical protein
MNKVKLEEIKIELSKYVQDAGVPEMDNTVLIVGSILEALLED